MATSTENLGTKVIMRSFVPPQVDGNASRDNLARADKKGGAMATYGQALKEVSNHPYEVIVSTTSNMSNSGVRLFEEQGLRVIRTDSEAKPVKYANMLNGVITNVNKEVDSIAIVSPSLVESDPIAIAKQLDLMVRAFYTWNGVAIIGSVLNNEHDRDLISAVIEGTKMLTLENICRVFPTNAISVVPKFAEFSPDTNTGALGKVMVNGKEVDAGGNEDFYWGLQQMLRGRPCIQFIDPYLEGERTDKVLTEAEKYGRREPVYERYARQLLSKAVERGALRQMDIASMSASEVSAVATYIVTRNFFFAKYNEDGNPEIVLTKAQKSLLPRF